MGAHAHALLWEGSLAQGTGPRGTAPTAGLGQGAQTAFLGTVRTEFLGVSPAGARLGLAYRWKEPEAYFLTPGIDFKAVVWMTRLLSHRLRRS